MSEINENEFTKIDGNDFTVPNGIQIFYFMK